MRVDFASETRSPLQRGGEGETAPAEGLGDAKRAAAETAIDGIAPGFLQAKEGAADFVDGAGAGLVEADQGSIDRDDHGGVNGGTFHDP